MRKFLVLFHRIVEHPISSGFISLVVFAASLSETVSTFDSDLKNTALPAHHGLLVFAAVQLLSSAASAIEGFMELTEKEVEEAEEDEAR